jgi:outer membrane autotransporter protein
MERKVIKKIAMSVAVSTLLCGSTAFAADLANNGTTAASGIAASSTIAENEAHTITGSADGTGDGLLANGIDGAATNKGRLNVGDGTNATVVDQNGKAIGSTEPLAILDVKEKATLKQSGVINAEKTYANGTLTLDGSTGLATTEVVLGGVGILNINGVNADKKALVGAIVGDGSHGTVNVNESVVFTDLVGKTAAANAVNIAASKSATLAAGENLITTTKLGSGSSLILADGANLTGAVTTSTDNSGTIVLGGDSTITGAIGADGKALSNITLKDGKKLILADAGDVYSKNITLGDSAGTGTILKVTGAKTITADIVAAAADKGALEIDEDVTITGNVGATDKKIEKIDIATTKTLTVSGNVYAAANVTLVDAGKMTLSGTDKKLVADTVTITEGTLDAGANSIEAATAVNFAHATGTLKLTTGTVTGDVTTSTTEEGTIEVAGKTTLAGKLGVSGTVLKKVDVKTGGDLTLSGAVFAKDIATAASTSLTITDEVTTDSLANAGTTTLGTKAFTGAIANDGTLNLSTGTVSGAITGAGTINVKEDYTAAAAIAGAKLNVEDGKTLALADATDAITGTTTIKGTGKIVSTENLNLGAVTLKDVGSYKDGVEYTVVKLTGAELTVSDIGGLTDTSMITYTVTSTADAATNDEIKVTANYKGASDLGLSSNAEKTYASLKGVLSNDKAIFDEIKGLSGKELDNAIKSMSPDSSTASATAGATSMANGSSTTITSHMKVARAYLANSTGISTGDNALNNSVWVQAYKSDAEQDSKDNISGFDVDGKGFVVGVDRYLTNSTIAGIALSRGEAAIDSKSTSRAETDVTTTQLTAYATTMMTGYYVEGLLTYALNENESSRHIVVGTVDRVASADYDSSLLGVRVGAGMPMNVAGMTITPKTGLNYTRLSTDTYTESGAGAMNLTVDTEDMTKYTLSAGVALAKNIALQDSSTFTPELRAGVSYDMGDDFTTSSSKFAGASDSFSTEGLDSSDISTDVGLGLAYATDDNTKEFRFDYDMNLKAGYEASTAKLTARFKF